jgi:hypothetical protein
MHSRLGLRLASFVGLVAIVALVAGACSSSASTPAPTPSAAAPTVPVATPAAPVATVQPASAPPTASVSTAPSAAASEAPSAAPSEVPPASGGAPSAAPTVPPVPSFAIPSFTSDKELEAALPTSYQGVTLKKFSFKGTGLVNTTSESGKQLVALLQSLGKTPDDLSLALASDPTGKLGVAFGAYRIKGADAGTWAPIFYRVSEQQTPGTTLTDVNLGGKSVKRIETPKLKDLTYAWARGDVLFFVSTTTDTLAGPAIAVMP